MAESQLEFGEASEQARDVFSRHLDLPRGTARERVRVNAHDYKLSGDDVRTLAAVGSFRLCRRTSFVIRIRGRRHVRPAISSGCAIKDS